MLCDWPRKSFLEKRSQSHTVKNTSMLVVTPGNLNDSFQTGANVLFFVVVAVPTYSSSWVVQSRKWICKRWAVIQIWQLANAREAAANQNWRVSQTKAGTKKKSPTHAQKYTHKHAQYQVLEYSDIVPQAQLRQCRRLRRSKERWCRYSARAL